MKRPKTEIGRTLLAAEDDRIWGRALVWGIIVVGAAFLASSIWREETWMRVPDGLDASRLARYQAAFSGVAAAVLLIPALTAFFFRNRALGHWRTWEACWMVSCVALLGHMGWAFIADMDGDQAGAIQSSQVPNVWPAIALGICWAFDLWMANRDIDERSRDGGQRILLHLPVIGLGVLSTASEGETSGPKVTGFALYGADIASGLYTWSKRGRSWATC